MIDFLHIVVENILIAMIFFDFMMIITITFYYDLILVVRSILDRFDLVLVLLFRFALLTSSFSIASICLCTIIAICHHLLCFCPLGLVTSSTFEGFIHVLKLFSEVIEKHQNYLSTFNFPASNIILYLFPLEFTDNFTTSTDIPSPLTTSSTPQ